MIKEVYEKAAEVLEKIAEENNVDLSQETDEDKLEALNEIADELLEAAVAEAIEEGSDQDVDVMALAGSDEELGKVAAEYYHLTLDQIEKDAGLKETLLRWLTGRGGKWLKKPSLKAILSKMTKGRAALYAGLGAAGAGAGAVAAAKRKD